MIGIIAVLISILLPALSRARESALRVQCASNMRQIGVALIGYSVANKNYIPSFNPITYRQPGGGGQTYNPGFWDDATLIQPLTKHGLVPAFVRCPSNEAYADIGNATNVIPEGVIPYLWPTGSAFDGDWTGNFVYLVGLAEEFGAQAPNAYNSPMNSAGDRAEWFDTNRSAANPKITKNKPDKIMVVDQSVWFSDSGGRFYANHRQKGRPFNGTPPVSIASVAGGNRLYVDGHVSWVPNTEMSTDGLSGQATGFKGRYSYSSGSRRFYW